MPFTIVKEGKKYCVHKADHSKSFGCHDNREQAESQVRALYAVEIEAAIAESHNPETEETELSGDTFVFADDMKEHKWSGPICFEGIPTGDNRIFKQNAIIWEPDTLPWALRWQKASGQGHSGSVPVGRVDKIERKDDGVIYGYGVVIPELNEEAAEYLRMLQTGVGSGVSVDGDSAQFEIQEAANKGETPRVEFSSMRLRALSCVDIPAFNGARIKLTDSPEENVEMSEEELIVDVTDDSSELAHKPMDEDPKDEDSEDEESEDEESEDEDSKDEDSEDEDSEDEDSKDEDSEDDEKDVSLEALREELAKKKKKRKKGMSHGYGWQIDDALVAAAVPTIPSTEAFVDPVFDGPTPLTVTPDGKVFGHLALFNTCHIGFPGTCVKPPKGSKYQYFHTGEIETVEGDLVEVGKLTFKTGHAEMAANPRVAAEHYDNTGAVAADVRAGEDKWGIWVVGALRPHLSDEDVRAFRAAPLSGDWRRIAGKLELIAALSVNVPGFPVPRVRALVASGETETLFTFLEDDNEEFIYSEEEIDVRLDRKIELAYKVMGDELDLTPPDGAITEEIPAAPTKKEVIARAENYTKNQLFVDLKAVRELLDDPGVEMSKKVRNAAEELYSLFIRVDNGKRFSNNGIDLDIVDASGLEIEEWEAELEFSGLDLQEFYNQCHGEDGKFCEGQDGPGRVRDKAPVSGRHYVQNAKPGTSAHGSDVPGESDADHASKAKASGGHGYTQGQGQGQGQQGQGQGQGQKGQGQGGQGQGQQGQGQGGGVNPKNYENFRVTRRRATGWGALAFLAAAALHSPASGILAGLTQAGGVALLTNPAVLTLAIATGVSFAAKNAVAARKHKVEYNRQVDRKIKRDRLNERQQRERDRLNVSNP